jgi:hypothetical protein
MGFEQMGLGTLFNKNPESKSIPRVIWEEVLAQAAETVTEIGPKRVADAFGMSDTTGLGHALAERNRARISGEQLVYLMFASKHDTLSAIVPAHRGMQLVPVQPMTAEEECLRWRSIADRMGEAGEWAKKQVYDRKTKP